MLEKTHFEEVSIEKLRWRCNPDDLNMETTDDLTACVDILGQERAVKAIKLGLDIKSSGYNIFATGASGTGRATSVYRLLKGKEKERIPPSDKCYVNNFKNPDMPRVIKLPAGGGSRFRKDMDDLIQSLRTNIPKILESEDHQNKKKETIEHLRDQEKEMVREFGRKVNQQNFSLVQVQLGPYTRPDIVPVIGGNTLSFDQLEKAVDKGEFSKSDVDALKEKYHSLSAELENIFKETRNIEKTIKEEIASVDNEAVMPLVVHSISEISEKYKDEKIDEYLEEVSESIIEDLDRFREKSDDKQSAPAIPGLALPQQKDEFLEYKVNVIVDNSHTEGAPIITENSPSYKNLFGTIENVFDRSGQWRTDFTKIKAGSYVRADGGYLILNAQDVLIEPGSWLTLKRAIKNKKVEIQTYDPVHFFTPSALKPEAIDVDVKVIMVGDPFIYYLLYHQDDDFKKIFKVRADFDSVMDKDQTSILQYACFIRKICDEENLRAFDKTSVAVVVEYGVKMAGRQNKMSSRFNNLADVIKEADYWAGQDGADCVSERRVDKAIKEQIERVSLIEDKLKERIDEGTIMIDTEGTKVGQVNGLAVYSFAEHSFGKPTRITTETSLGRSGIINIDREADLSGKTHDKGVLIIGGYLRGKYAQEMPLTMSASLCFEQSYSEIDGDSASSTEIYAILSSLAGLPLRQDLAVTGSVNQKGEIQPIGGVNQKIEGFFDVCRTRGLTGTQGVIIPYLNIPDLMLRKDVVKAVSERKFHIYPVKTIDQGAEILTGVEAGEERKDRAYPEGTVNFLVDQRLRELTEKLKDFGSENGETPKKDKK